MAASNMTTSDALAVKVWEAKTFKANIKESFWLGRVGNLDTKGSMDQNGLLTIYTNLEKNPGDVINIPHVPRWLFTAIGESGTVEGNEGSISQHNFQLTLEEKNIAIRYRNTLAKQRASFDWAGIHRQRVDQRGAEVLDEQIFDALQATDPNKMFWGGSATSNATLTTSDLITPKKLTTVRTWSETGGNRSQNSIGKLKVGGQSAYAFLFHNDVFNDLWNDTTIQQAYRDAAVRGGDNPLFRDADLVWNGNAIFKHENVDIFTNGGSGANVPYAKGFLMGAGAMAFAWGKRPKLNVQDFDYDREVGMNYCFTSAAGRPEFNALDYGVVGFNCARTQISDV